MSSLETMEFERYGFPGRRSNVMAYQGMVATSQPLAAQAGLKVLQSGGNAIDAAIATAAVLAVVEPCSTGLGGDAFGLIWWAADRRLYGLNASGPAAEGLSAELLRRLGHRQMPTEGGLTVTVPGSVRGWQLALERFGSWGLDRVLAPSFHYASQGYPVSQRIARAWQGAVTKLVRQEASRRAWLMNGRAPRPGELFRNPALATTLQALTERGYNAFYDGPIAQEIVSCVTGDGGRMSLYDLAGYEAEWVDPISLNYDGDFTFHELPPNGQGLTALMALQIVQGFPRSSLEYGSVESWHLQIEAIKLAFADATAYVADPRQVEVPVSRLLDPSYAAQRREHIKRDRALLPHPGRPPQRGGTVYLTVADQHGNMVSWIQSLYDDFGSGLTAGDTGILLHNRGANFSLETGHPNELAPGKRPYHTIIPGFITHQGQAWCSFGVMGGFMQPQGHLQVGLNLVRHRMDPQTALDAPRFRWLENRRVAIEPAAGGRILRGLSGLGHVLLSPAETRGLSFGGGQIIIRDPETGLLIGGSEPRKDGAAVGW